MLLDRLDDLVADRVGRVERSHRLLEDHREPRTAQVAEQMWIEVQQIAPLEQDPPADLRILRRQQAHDGQRRDALAAARLAHQTESPALAQRQVDAVDGVDDTIVGGEVHRQAA